MLFDCPQRYNPVRFSQLMLQILKLLQQFPLKIIFPACPIFKIAYHKWTKNSCMLQIVI